MDWIKIYYQIIERAKSRKLEGYKEKHHIIPKCLGGLDITTNLVELTAREHFLCHKLLVIIYPSNSKLKFALWAMCNWRSKKHNRYSPSSKVYEQIKKEFIKMAKGRKKPDGFSEKMSKVHKGKKCSKETKEKMSSSTLGVKKHTEESKEKLRQYRTGKVISEETRKKISDSNKGKKHTEEQNKKSSEKLKGRKITWNLKGIKKRAHIRSTNIPIMQYDLDNNFIKEYKTISEAANGNRSLAEGIRKCLSGEYKKSGGFIWKPLKIKK